MLKEPGILYCECSCDPPQCRVQSSSRRLRHLSRELSAVPAEPRPLTYLQPLRPPLLCCVHRALRQGFINAVIKFLRPELCMPEDVLVRKGELANSMYFVESGVLEVSPARRDGTALTSQRALYSLEFSELTRRLCSCGRTGSTGSTALRCRASVRQLNCLPLVGAAGRARERAVPARARRILRRDRAAAALQAHVACYRAHAV